MTKLSVLHKSSKPLKQNKGFKLQWLPMLARNEVVRSMKIKDIVMLSLSSRKTEGMIRYAKVSVHNIDLHVNTNHSTLDIESLYDYSYHCGPDQRKKGSNKLVPPIFSRWINKDSSSFQNCVSILKHLQNFISFNYLCLYVNLEDMTVHFIKEILTEAALIGVHALCLDKGKLDAECLDLVMETARTNRILHIEGTKIPEDYCHKNAFKFFDIAYWNARWVRIEDLFDLKNCFEVRLSRNNLTYFYLNTYIRFWIENDYDMVEKLSLFTKVPIQSETLFDGIVVFQGRRREFTTYLVASNPTKQRKHQIMCVGWHNNEIHLFSNNVPLLVGEEVFVESWEAEYQVLRALNKKEELEEELKEIEKAMQNNQNQNLVEKENDISRNLRNVSVELDNYNLVFENGVYSFM